MVTTNSILPPLTLTKEEVIEVLIDDLKTSRFGPFAALRQLAAVKYMNKNFSQKDIDFVWKAVAEIREKEKKENKNEVD